jgi:hypothetical protein
VETSANRRHALQTSPPEVIYREMDARNGNTQHRPADLYPARSTVCLYHHVLIVVDITEPPPFGLQFVSFDEALEPFLMTDRIPRRRQIKET